MPESSKFEKWQNLKKARPEDEWISIDAKIPKIKPQTEVEHLYELYKAGGKLTPEQIKRMKKSFGEEE